MGRAWVGCLVALLACVGCASAPPAVRVVPIATLNDFHGALYERAAPGDEGQRVGGLPVLAGAISHLREQMPSLVVLDGGDLFQGSIPVNATRGMGAVWAFDLLGVDAAAVGNHEFDYGPAASGEGHPLRGALEEAAKQARFEWLVANIWETAEGGARRRWQPEGIAPWVILERGGTRIGIIGLSTVETPATTLYENVSDLEFEDVVEALRRELPRVREAGAEVVAVVGHLTGACPQPAPLAPAESCLPDGELGRILTELPRGAIDVLVSGHTHRLMAFRWDDTFVLGAGALGMALGRVDLAVRGGAVDADASTLHPPWILTHRGIDPGCEGGEVSTAPLEVGGAEGPMLRELLVAHIRGAGACVSPVAEATPRLVKAPCE